MLAPEINSGRIYAGPGPGSMLSASLAWTELAAELHWAAASYWSSITALTEGSWLGPSSAAMAAAAAPFAAWLRASATQAEQTASQAEAAAGAYETALAMTVPPALVAENRAALATLIATNVLGQNAPAIAMTEASYYEMWAQDATAMYAYAASSAVAATVAPFQTPPPTTNQPDRAASPAQAVNSASTGTAESTATQTFSDIPAALNGMASPTMPTESTSTLSSLTTLNLLSYPARFATYPLNFLSKAFGFSKSAAAPASALTTGAAATGPGLTGGAGSSASTVAARVGLISYAPAVSAGMGQAHTFGPLSVPSTWSSTTAHAITPAAAAAGSPGSGSGITPVMPIGNPGGRTAVAATPRYDMRPRVIPRSPAAG